MAETAFYIVAALATTASVIESKKASDAQEEARDEQRAQGKADTIRAKRRQIRESRVRREQAANVAAQTGAQDSSSASQNEGSIQSQLGTNLSFLDTTAARSDRIFDAQSTVAKHQTRAGIFSAVGNVASRGAVAAASTPKAVKPKGP